MPQVIECPSCKWKGSVPDVALGKRLRCPSCKNEFIARLAPSAPPAEDDLDVVEDEALTARKPVSRGAEDDEEDDDRPRRKRRRDREDDEDDEEDRPRKRRRGRDDDDEDEDEDDRRSRKPSKYESDLELLRLRRSLLLNYIAAAIYLGSLGLFLLIWLIGLISSDGMSHDVYALPGLVGLGNWVVALVGFSFGVAGPSRNAARGLGIATLAVAGVHLLTAVVGLLIGEHGALGVRLMNWEILVTGLEFVPLLVVLFSGSVIVVFLVWLLEVARLFLYALTLHAHATAFRKYDLIGRSKGLAIGVGSVGGGLLLVALVLGLIARNASSVSAWRAVGIISVLTAVVGMGGMAIWYFFVVKQARDAFEP